MKVFTVKKELLDVGKEIIKNSFGHEIPIYNRERTICDLVRSRSRFEIQDYQTALKTYIGGKGKDLNRYGGDAVMPLSQAQIKGRIKNLAKTNKSDSISYLLF